MDPVPERQPFLDSFEGPSELVARRLAREASVSAASARLGLQQRASDNLRRHVARAVRRVAVLLCGDLTAYFFARECLVALRDQAVVGVRVGRILAELLPQGEFRGWQFAAALVVGLVVTGNYGQGDERRSPARLILGCAFAAALSLWGAAWSRDVNVALVQYAAIAVAMWAALLLERLVLDRAVALVIPPERVAARALFVGPAGDCVEVLESSGFQPRAGFRSVGFVDLELPSAAGALGHIDQFPSLLQRSGADTVVVSGKLPKARFQEVVDAALVAGCELLAVPRAFEIGGVEPALLGRPGKRLIKLTTPGLRGQQYVVKRAIDLVSAVAGLVVLAPLFVVIAGLVKFDSPGPVFFRQRRVGQGGRLFRILKFRTMRVGADTERADLLVQNIYRDSRLFKVKSDPRVTGVGRWLRGLSLDELPQLVNVLWGEMSLVGPRPPLPAEVELYLAPHYARFDVKPGLTGPWQVLGRSDIPDFEQIVGLETDYIRHWSLAQDFLILAKTVPAVLKRRGAH